jgi:hypothetical protein
LLAKRRTAMPKRRPLTAGNSDDDEIEEDAQNRAQGRVLRDNGLGEEIAAEKEKDEAQSDLREPILVEALDRPFLDLFDVDHVVSPKWFVTQTSLYNSMDFGCVKGFLYGF